MAAFIIKNGAAAYDHEVTISRTFWGMNAMRKDETLGSMGTVCLKTKKFL